MKLSNDQKIHVDLIGWGAGESIDLKVVRLTSMNSIFTQEYNWNQTAAMSFV